MVYLDLYFENDIIDLIYTIHYTHPNAFVNSKVEISQKIL